jgi:thiol-disulfide isomerase/thioredoxin
MKRTIYILFISIVLVSCKTEPHKDYAALKGKILNPGSDLLFLESLGGNGLKTIKVNEDGTFSDTIKANPPWKYMLGSGKGLSMMYLKNGYDLVLTLDNDAFDQSLVYSGIGSETNNYLHKKFTLSSQLRKEKRLLTTKQSSIEIKYNAIVNALSNFKNGSDDLEFISSEEKELKILKEDLTKAHERRKILLNLPGKESPKFIDYENHAGGTMSLDDLKGKYVYIDFWATWCAPCIKEIPYLKKVEEAYKEKNIEFVSISVDKKRDYEKWKNMVRDKEMSGIQLWFKEDRTFRDAVGGIEMIPTFFLIDPEGKIVSVSAPPPSDPKLIELFDKQGL